MDGQESVSLMRLVTFVLVKSIGGNRNICRLTSWTGVMIYYESPETMLAVYVFDGIHYTTRDREITDAGYRI